MKKFLHRLPLPDTLIGQLSLSLSITLIIFFIVNIAVVCFIQAHFLNFIERERATNIASFYMLFFHMEDSRRKKMLHSVQSFNNRSKNSFTLSLTDKKPMWLDIVEQNPDYIKNTKRAVTNIKNSLYENSVSVVPHIFAKILPYDDTSLEKKFTLYDKLILQVAIQLDEHQWLYISQPLFVSIQQLVWVQRFIFFIEFVIFSLITLFLVKKYLVPFRRLAKSADSIGEQPEISSPIPEKGYKEIREAARSFNRMQEKIQNNLAERNRMLSAMAHDLRTPLTRAQLRIEDIASDTLRDKLAEDIKEISSIAKQSLELATSLTTTEKSVPFDIIAFMQSCVDDMCALGYDVCMFEPVEVSVNPLVVLAKPLSLKRCMDNLLNNAVVYGKNASVAVYCVDKKIYIDICDNGQGIPEEFLERVVEPYFRLETSRNRESGGSGLGLSIVKNMLLLNKGTLHLQNRKSTGLRARVILPHYKHGQLPLKNEITI